MVILTEPGGHVDHARSVAGVHEVCGQNPEGVGAVVEEVEQRRVGATHQVTSGAGTDLGGLCQLDGVALDGLDTHHQHGAVGVGSQGVANFGAHGEGQVGWQRPWGGRPRQNPHGAWVAVDRCQVEGHGDGWVLPGSGGVVKADLKVG